MDFSIGDPAGAEAYGDKPAATGNAGAHYMADAAVPAVREQFGWHCPEVLSP